GERIRISKPGVCRARELRAVGKRFEREVLPLLTPIAIGSAAPFPHVPSLGLNLAVLVEDQSDQRLVCVSIPPGVPRFVDTGERSPSRTTASIGRRHRSASLRSRRLQRSGTVT